MNQLHLIFFLNLLLVFELEVPNFNIALYEVHDAGGRLVFFLFEAGVYLQTFIKRQLCSLYGLFEVQLYLGQKTRVVQASCQSYGISSLQLGGFVDGGLVSLAALFHKLVELGLVAFNVRKVTEGVGHHHVVEHACLERTSGCIRLHKVLAD